MAQKTSRPKFGKRLLFIGIGGSLIVGGFALALLALLKAMLLIKILGVLSGLVLVVFGWYTVRRVTSSIKEALVWVIAIILLP